MTDDSVWNWSIEGDELLIRNRAEVRQLSADEIFKAVIENQQIIPGVPAGNPNVENLTFSRYPADLRLEIGQGTQLRESGLFCSVRVQAGDSEAELATLAHRVSDHIVIDGKWYPFAMGAIDELSEIISEAGVVDTGPISFKSFLALRKLAETNELVVDLTSGRTLHPGTTAAEDPDSLDLFQGSLYQYQKEGWRWLNFVCLQKVGGILADEMGLGKTVQIIAALASSQREIFVPSMIVAPTTLLENWRREFQKFAPGIRTLVHQGPRRTGSPAELGKPDVVITSYETVVRDSSLFAMISWKVVVLDEAQAIKNPETRRAAAIKRLNRESGLAVTGTPVENKLRDLWSILDFAVPGFLGSEAEFERRFGDNSDGAARLEPFVSPLMLRRKVAEVAQDLPDRIDIPEALSLSDREVELYERIRHDIVAEYGSAATLVALTKLRMFCAHPFLVQEERDMDARAEDFSKFQRLCEIAEEIFSNSEKVIVFTSYNLMSDLITGHMNSRYGVFAKTIDGRTPVADRQDIVDEFSAYGGPGLLSLNPRAAGTGLNITAANHVIHYNLEWNPAIEDQASARAYRRGQSKPVTVHRLFMADTVEEVMDDRLQRKRDIADTAVVGVAGDEGDADDILRALQLTPVH